MASVSLSDPAISLGRIVSCFTALAVTAGLAILPLALRVEAAVPTSPSQYGIWADSVVPKTTSDSDTASVELGLKFTTSVAGKVHSVRFYRGANNIGVHVGTLWVDTGQQLGRTTFASDLKVGWVEAKFPQPIAVAAGAVYVVSYSAPNGRYASDQFKLGSGRTVRTGSLTALQGVYSYDRTMPENEWNGSNYYVDVSFEPAMPAGGTTPTAASRSSSIAPWTTRSTVPTSTTTPSTGPTDTTTRSTATPTSATAGGGGNTFPTAGTTGASGTLAKYTGPAIVTLAGTVISNVEISGRLTIKANNVKLINVRIISSDYWVLLNFGVGTVVENSTLTGTANSQASIGDIDGGSFVGRKLNISGAADGVKMGAYSKIYDSFIHDLASFSGSHNDGIEVTNGYAVEIVRNTILNANSQTSAIFLDEFEGGEAGTTLVRGNLIAGGGYSIYGGAPEGRGIKIINNSFSTRYFVRSGSYGPVAYWSAAGNTWSGNVWADGSARGDAVAP